VFWGGGFWIGEGRPSPPLSPTRSLLLRSSRGSYLISLFHKYILPSSSPSVPSSQAGLLEVPLHPSLIHKCTYAHTHTHTHTHTSQSNLHTFVHSVPLPDQAGNSTEQRPMCLWPSTDAQSLAESQLRDSMNVWDTPGEAFPCSSATCQAWVPDAQTEQKNQGTSLEFMC
jgi:hypothetical protein